MLVKAQADCLAAGGNFKIEHGAEKTADLQPPIIVPHRNLAKRFVRMGGSSVNPITEAIAKKTVGIIEALSLRNAIGLMDALVFVTALDGGFTLCSGNYKHFRDLEGLESIVFRP